MSTETRARTGRPMPGEFADYAQPDVDFVAGDDAVTALSDQEGQVIALFDRLSDDDVRGVRYAAGKWTIKQVLGHLADDERIFAYRILCVARGDDRPLAGFDENDYMRHAGFEDRTLADLIAEYRSVRQATLSLLEGLPVETWTRRGIVNGYEASVRGLAFHIAGHELRHLRALRDRYLPLVGRGG